MSDKLIFLEKTLKNKGLDAMIVSDETNIQYLIGINVEGILLLTPQQNIFLTNKRYADYVSSMISIEKGVNILTLEKTSKKELEEIFWGLSRVGIEEKAISYREYLNYKDVFDIDPVKTDGIIEDLRETKDDLELENIQKASEILSDVYEKALDNIKKGMTEKQVVYNINRLLKQTDLELVDDSIQIQSGINSSKPYFMPTNRKLAKGDSVIITLKAKYNGYFSEISRTIFIGQVDEKQKEEYNRLLRVHDSLLRNIKNRAEISKITKEHFKMLEDINWDIKYYIAHGIGMNKEEAPCFETNSNKTIKNRMTIVIEPRNI